MATLAKRTPRTYPAPPCHVLIRTPFCARLIRALSSATSATQTPRLFLDCLNRIGETVKVIRGLSVVVRVFPSRCPSPQPLSSAAGRTAAQRRSILRPRGIEATASGRQNVCCAGLGPLQAAACLERLEDVVRYMEDIGGGSAEFGTCARASFLCVKICSSDASMSLCNVSHGFIYSFQCDLVSTLTVDIHLYFQLLSAPNHGGSCLLEQTFHRVLLFSTVASYSLFCDTQSYIQYSVSK
jgi:hypothetical protein